MNGNPYEILGVPYGASPEVVREAYLNLMRQYHPDQYADPAAKEMAEAKIREINAAYDAITLGNQQQAPPSWDYQQASGQRPPYGAPKQSPYYRSSRSPSCCEAMTCLCCADSCCECMGGDLCLCC